MSTLQKKANNRTHLGMGGMAIITICCLLALFCTTIYFAVMDNYLGFLLKVFILSLAISLLIKFIGPSLGVPPTNAIALVVVLSPTVIMGILFFWRFQNQQGNL